MCIAYDDYIPINNSMAIQHFLMVITLRMTHGLYRIHTSDWTRKRQNNGVGIYKYMLTCVAFGVNHTVGLHVFFSQCDVLDDVEMTLTLDNDTDNGIQTFKQSKYSKYSSVSTGLSRSY